ncbi:S-adenosyl-L-methionine-dependent methyltransferase [Neoconidiobolus thromboides FSU 785]|nr:S-adenosyl-L-methionine-dependent methyltransferase [Neoconidiobolus thromboides FSU 785]
MSDIKDILNNSDKVCDIKANGYTESAATDNRADNLNEDTQINKKIKTESNELENSNKKQPKKKKLKKPKPMPSDSNILMDLHSLNPKLINSKKNEDFNKSLFYEYLPFERFTEYEVEIVKLASNGTGIGVTKDVKDWFILVPFTTIGDIVKTRVFSHCRGYSEGDFVELISRGNSSLKLTEAPCKYFGTCSGCQWQNFTYETQLELKENLLKRAFLYGSRPLMELIHFDKPEESPLKFNYRTKLTPHFDKPKSSTKEGSETKCNEVGLKADIGFNEKGRRKIMDIEDCILATPAVSNGYKLEREKVNKQLDSYKRGATLIIRESLTKDDNGNEVVDVVNTHKGIVTQPVGDLRFKYPSGSFFQVNASILPRLTEYVMSEFTNAPLAQKPKYLLDVYCGSGLFAVACSSAFEKVVGVDVNDQSIAFASKNAELNNIDNCSFKLGEAEVIFKGLEFNGDETAVIIDPPRKGCSEDFIKQLIDFAPSSIVYVSCNPFTQARDLQMLLDLTGGNVSQGNMPKINSVENIREICPEFISPLEAEKNWESFTQESDKEVVKQYTSYIKGEAKKMSFTYKIVKVKPFDMFPQTMHIESLLTLVKVPL